LRGTSGQAEGKASSKWICKKRNFLLDTETIATSTGLHMNPRRVVIVEADDNLRQAIQVELELEGYETQPAASAEEALAIIEKRPHHLVITDLNLPGISGLDLLKRVRVDNPDTEIIVMTAFGTVKTAVEAMKAGAYDYITKPIDPHELKALVKCAIGRHQLLEEARAPGSCPNHKHGFEEIVGSSPALLQSLGVAARVAATDATVLIYGETGTGKELVAKAIHMRSNRRDQPFMTINCGAIPRELLESELFGHTKGSFTGAVTDKKGRIEIANHGTVFLDEIGEMPLDLQVRILRVIQEHEIEKVGATAPTKVDVRIIAATHRDLAAMVKENSFREDLYYRLLVVPITLPPLRDRQGDVPALVEHFFLKLRAKNNRPDLILPERIYSFFSRYHWPGNIRQLENAVERLVLLAEGPEISVGDLPDYLKAEPVSASMPLISPPEGEVNLQDIEKQLILQAMEKCHGNQTHAARYLNMTRRALGYRLEKYGLKSDAVKSQRGKASNASN
jgi:DNA-binding NtrC family response regulator